MCGNQINVKEKLWSGNHLKEDRLLGGADNVFIWKHKFHPLMTHRSNSNANVLKIGYQGRCISQTSFDFCWQQILHHITMHQLICYLQHTSWNKYNFFLLFLNHDDPVKSYYYNRAFVLCKSPKSNRNSVHVFLVLGNYSHKLICLLNIHSCTFKVIKYSD